MLFAGGVCVGAGGRDEGFVVRPLRPGGAKGGEGGEGAETIGVDVFTDARAGFVGDEKVEADAPRGLIAVGGEPAYAFGLVDDHEVIVRGRVEGHAELLGGEVGVGGDVVAGDEEVVAADGAVSAGGKVERDAVASHEGIVVIGRVVGEERLLVGPFVLQFRLGEEGAMAVLNAGVGGAVATWADVDGRGAEGVGGVGEERGVGHEATIVVAQEVGGEQAILVDHHAVDHAHQLRLLLHSLHLLQRLKLILDGRCVGAAFLFQLRHLAAEHRGGLVEAVGARVEVGQVAVGVGRLASVGRREVSLGRVEGAGLVAADAVPEVVGGIGGRLGDELFEERFGLRVSAFVVQLLSLLQALRPCSAGDARPEEEGRRDDS